MDNDKPIKKKITRFGYILYKPLLTQKEIETIKSDLLITPFKMGNYGKAGKNSSFKLFVENGDYIGIPKYYGIEKFGQPDINKIETYPFPKFDMQYMGTLRPNQQIIVDKIIKGFDEGRGGLLIAGCGSGKTNMAIYIACHYKLKTLFISHKTFLKNQAVNRIKSTTNIEVIGIIQGKKVKTNCPFIVGMVQSLSSIDYDDIIFKDIGMIVIDEVHHMGARNFSKLFKKMSAKYMLGISAEQMRNDNTYHIINWYMGPILHVEEQKPNEMVIVKIINFKSSNEKRTKIIVNKFTKEPDRSTMITNLVSILKRNRLILKTVETLFDHGKNILCLSGRIKHVEIFYKLLNKNKYINGNVGKYLGGMSEAELKESGTKQIILGTYSMAEEGLDIPNLNAIILCTPKSSVKQSIGRILRKEIYEEHPLVIDITDCDNYVFKNQSRKRQEYYRKQKYAIQHAEFADYELKNHFMWDDEEEIDRVLKKPIDKKKVSAMPVVDEMLNIEIDDDDIY